MARYRKIDPRIWNDAKFSSLSHEAQRMFFFVLTHPAMTSLGAFRISQSGMAEELGLAGKGFAEPFGELFRKGLINYDERAFLLFVPNFLKYNQPENPNVVKGWKSAIDLLPECDLKINVLAKAKACTANNDALSKAFDNAFGSVTERVTETLSEGLPKPLSKGMPNQEQEQEQDKEEVKEKPQCRKADAIRPSPLVEKIVAVYEETTKGRLSQIQAMTDKRKRAVKKFVDFYRKQVNAVDEAAFLSAVREYFRRAVRSSFLTGQNDRGWKADFDFLMNENKALALLEGKYDDKKTETNQFRTPVHDWRAEQDAYFAKKREEELDHAEALEACLCGAKA